MENNLGNSVIIIVAITGLLLFMLCFVSQNKNQLLIVQNLYHRCYYSCFIFQWCRQISHFENNWLIFIEKLSVKSHILVFLLPCLLIQQCFGVGILLTLLHTQGNWVLDIPSQSHTRSECWNICCSFDLSQLEVSIGFGVLVEEERRASRIWASYLEAYDLA